jgi:hypothetical protein
MSCCTLGGSALKFRRGNGDKGWIAFDGDKSSALLEKR